MLTNIRYVATVAAFVTAVALGTDPAAADAGHSHGHGTNHAQSYSAGLPGDSKKPARIVLVTMKETADGKMIYEPRSLEVKRGEQVRFVLTNAGELPHEFVLASVEDNLKHAEAMKQNPDMNHEEPNGKMLASRTKSEFVWHFTKAGTFEFACLIPGHREAGMTGTVTVR